MKKNLDNYIKILTSKGFVILEDMLKRKETKIIRSKLENILKKEFLIMKILEPKIVKLCTITFTKISLC